MASIHRYGWRPGDQIWFLAARFLDDAGYTDVSTFVDAIRAANPAVLDFTTLPSGTVIVIPYLTS